MNERPLLDADQPLTPAALEHAVEELTADPLEDFARTLDADRTSRRASASSCWRSPPRTRDRRRGRCCWAGICAGPNRRKPMTPITFVVRVTLDDEHVENLAARFHKPAADVVDELRRCRMQAQPRDPLP